MEIVCYSDPSCDVRADIEHRTADVAVALSHCAAEFPDRARPPAQVRRKNPRRLLPAG